MFSAPLGNKVPGARDSVLECPAFMIPTQVFCRQSPISIMATDMDTVRFACKMFCLKKLGMFLSWHMLPGSDILLKFRILLPIAGAQLWRSLSER